MEKVYVPKTAEEKAEQRALLQYFRPQNKKLVLSALKKAGRYDLIGNGKNCLVCDDLPAKQAQKAGNSPAQSQKNRLSTTKTHKNGDKKSSNKIDFQKPKRFHDKNSKRR